VPRNCAQQVMQQNPDKEGWDERRTIKTWPGLAVVICFL